MTIRTANSKETEFVGLALARLIQKRGSRDNIIIALNGPLGSGKTTFIKGLARGLGIRQSIVSPTFLIMRHYRFRGVRYHSLLHLDAYRLRHSRELVPLKFDEELKKKSLVIVIEWPLRLKTSLPSHSLWIFFRHGRRENERSLQFAIK